MSKLIKCLTCQTEMSSEAKACPQCGAPNKKKGGCLKIAMVLGCIFFALIILGSIAGGGSKEPVQKSDSPSVTVAKIELPKSESDLIEVVKKAQMGASQAENDMARGGILAARNNSLKGMPVDVQDWIGVVTKVDSNSDGKGVLSIEIAPDVTVKTWNNAISDSFNNTLLEPGTPLFNTAAALKKGQQVQFSGHFFLDDESGFKESSLTLRGKLKEPAFIFKFSSIKGL